MSKRPRDASSGDGARGSFRALGLLVAGLVVSVSLGVLVPLVGGGAPGAASAGSALVDDCVVWLPLVAATLLARRSSLRDRVLWPSFRFDLLDVFWGFAIACLVRALDAFVSLERFGTTGLVHAPAVAGGSGAGLGSASVVWAVLGTALWAVVAVGGTCVVTPVVEEAFFRGALQPVLAAVLGRWAGRWPWVARRVGVRRQSVGRRRRPWVARWLGVSVGAAVFGIAHVLLGRMLLSGGGAAQVFVTTFVLAVLAGGLVARTGRLGGAILAHVFCNGIAVALTWPA